MKTLAPIRDAPAPGEAKRPAPASDGVVCFAAADWWYHSRGHSECQIAQRLSRLCPVLFVNSIGMRRPHGSGAAKPTTRVLRKLRSMSRGLQRDANGVWVLSPKFVPAYSDRAARFNGRLIARQVRAALRQIGASRPAAFVTLPTAAFALDHLDFTTVVHNRCDDFGSFPQADASSVGAWESHLRSHSDATLFANRRLFEEERRASPQAELIGHGVDAQHFDPSQVAPVPDEWRDLERPIYGLVGALDEYRLDVDLLHDLAARMDRGTLVLVGLATSNLERLKSCRNVRILPPVPHAEVPRVAAAFDVGLLPYRRSRFVEHSQPIKLLEYLALGIPVVATPIPAARELEPHVVTAERGADFHAAALAAVNKRSAAECQARRDFARQFDWEQVSDRCAELLGVKP